MRGLISEEARTEGVGKDWFSITRRIFLPHTSFHHLQWTSNTIFHHIIFNHLKSYCETQPSSIQRLSSINFPKFPSPPVDLQHHFPSYYFQSPQIIFLHHNSFHHLQWTSNTIFHHIIFNHFKSYFSLTLVSITSSGLPALFSITLFSIT